MKVALCVLVACVIAVVLADPPKPQMPTAFQTYFHSVYESRGQEFSMVGKQYYDHQMQHERFDVQDPKNPGQFDIIIRDYHQQKEYRVMNNEASCTIKKFNETIPVWDFSAFSYIGPASVNGVLCDQWRETARGSADFYDTASDHLPVRLEGTMQHGGGETVDWWQFIAGPQDPVLFFVDPGWNCK